jgi:hypothetical protein
VFIGSRSFEVGAEVYPKVVVCGDGACGMFPVFWRKCNSILADVLVRVGKTSLLNVFTRGFFTQV